VFNVHQSLTVEVIIAGLNNRANSDSEISYCLCTHGSDLQRMLSLEQLKCSGCTLGGTYSCYKASSASDIRLSTHFML